MVRHNSRHSHRQHWLYVWIPAFAAALWFSTLLSMLITWLAQGRPHYSSMAPNQHIAYISDVGADILKPLFIVGCSITGLGFFLTLVVERWLRHSGRLLPHMRRRENVMAALAIFGSAIGGVGLVLLSVFDTKHHPSMHRGFLLMFMLGVAISAIFTVGEFRWLNKDFGDDVRKLRISYITKAVIAGTLITLAVAFGVTLDRKSEAAGVLEWVISFGFTLYLLSFWSDLRQSRGVRKGELSKERLVYGSAAYENGVDRTAYGPGYRQGNGIGATKTGNAYVHAPQQAM